MGLRKLRVYLDTSVISHLDAFDAPERMADTHRFWHNLREGSYQAVVSNVVLNEISQCEPPKQEMLLGYLREIDYEFIVTDQSAVDFAARIVDFGVLRIKSLDDCLHIAAAVVNECDAIVSWNFKHIVNHRTIQGVKIVAAMQGYRDVMIYSPTFLAEGADIYDD